MPDPRVISSFSEAFDYEGVSILYVATPAEIRGVGTRGVGVLGEFERGPIGSITEVTDAASLFNTYGAASTSSSYKGMVAVLAGSWGGNLYIARAAAAAAAMATSTGTAAGYAAAAQKVRFDAKYKGVYGNSITVTTAAGTTGGKKYTFIDTSTGRSEVFDNVSNVLPIGAGLRGLPTSGESILVDVTSIASGEPDTVVATNLISGAEGSIAAGDYTGANGIQLFEGMSARNVNVFFVADYAALADATINAQVKTSANNAKRWIGVVGINEAQTTAAAITDVANYRSEYLVYAFGQAKVRIGGVDTEFTVPPNTWVAASISKTPIHFDITCSEGAVGCERATSVVTDVSMSAYASLRAAGIVHLENDRVLGIHPAASILTTADAAKQDINRLRVGQFIGQSVAEAIRVYQGKSASKKRRREILGITAGFLGTITDNGDNDDPMLDAFRVTDEDTASPAEKSRGLYVLLIQAKLLTTLRFVVVKVEIGTNTQIEVN